MGVVHDLYAVLLRGCWINCLGGHDFCGNYRVMNQLAKIDIRHSTCPHDCPSACALDIEVIDNSTIGRVRGSKLQTYTAGVVCAKVARYAERIHHPDRLLYPLKRTGPKGSGSFARISWDEALDSIGRKFL
jgi:anaerobic selenocysteine-containing dehydrogenase